MRTIALPNITLGQLKKDDTEIFNVQSHSAKQLRHFKYESVHLLISLFTSQTFLTQVIDGFFYHFNFFFRSPCQRQCEVLPSLGIHRPLTLHMLIYSSKTT